MPYRQCLIVRRVSLLAVVLLLVSIQVFAKPSGQGRTDSPTVQVGAGVEGPKGGGEKGGDQGQGSSTDREEMPDPPSRDDRRLDLPPGGAGFSDEWRRDLEALEDWLKSSEDSRSFSAIGLKVMEQATTAAKSGVPPNLFLMRLKEAAAKKIPADQFALSIAVDTGNWMFIAATIAEAGWLPAQIRASFFMTLGSAMRNGFNQQETREMLVWAYAKKMPAERVAIALFSFAGSRLGTDFHKMYALRVSRGLVSSKLRTDQFSEALLMLKASLEQRRVPQAIVAEMESVMSAGGTLGELKKALAP